MSDGEDSADTEPKKTLEERVANLETKRTKFADSPERLATIDKKQKKFRRRIEEKADEA